MTSIYREHISHEKEIEVSQKKWFLRWDFSSGIFLGNGAGNLVVYVFFPHHDFVYCVLAIIFLLLFLAYSLRRRVEIFKKKVIE